MGLLRVEPSGRERPHVLIGDDRILDISNIDGDCLTGEGLARAADASGEPSLAWGNYWGTDASAPLWHVPAKSSASA